MAALCLSLSACQQSKMAYAGSLWADQRKQSEALSLPAMNSSGKCPDAYVGQPSGFQDKPFWTANSRPNCMMTHMPFAGLDLCICPAWFQASYQAKLGSLSMGQIYIDRLPFINMKRGLQELLVTDVGSGGLTFS